jgi:pullulanase
MTSASEIRDNLTFLDSPANMIAFLLEGRGVDDTWGQIIVIYNANTTDTTFRLPHGTWNAVVNLEQAGEQILGRVMETVTVAAVACMVLYRNDITGLL